MAGTDDSISGFAEAPANFDYKTVEKHGRDLSDLQKTVGDLASDIETLRGDVGKLPKTGAIASIFIAVVGLGFAILLGTVALFLPSNISGLGQRLTVAETTLGTTATDVGSVLEKLDQLGVSISQMDAAHDCVGLSPNATPNAEALIASWKGIPKAQGPELILSQFLAFDLVDRLEKDGTIWMFCYSEFNGNGRLFAKRELLLKYVDFELQEKIKESVESQGIEFILK